MDRFREEVVRKHKRGLEEVMYYLAFVVMVLTGLTALLYISAFLSYITQGFDFYSLIVGLLNAAVCVYLFLRRDRLRTEYEYTFTNGALDFAQVFNNAKRKSLGSLNVKTVDAFGPVNSASFQRYIGMQGMKQSRWFLNREAELYYFYFQKESNKRIIVFEPSKEMVEDIRAFLPYGVYQE